MSHVELTEPTSQPFRLGLIENRLIWKKKYTTGSRVRFSNSPTFVTRQNQNPSGVSLLTGSRTSREPLRIFCSSHPSAVLL